MRRIDGILSLVAAGLFGAWWVVAQEGGGPEGGGGATPGGSAFSTQYNNAGDLGGAGPGTAGQILTSNGAAMAPTFEDAPSATPGGMDTNIQVNDGGTFGGSDELTYTAGLDGFTVSPNGTPRFNVDEAGQISMFPDPGNTNVFIGGNLGLSASTTTESSLNMPHGTAPSSPSNGDMWTTTSGLFARINGATVGPYGTGASFPLLGSNGSNSAPTYSFSANTDFGMYYQPTGTTLRIAADGSDVIMASSSLLSLSPGGTAIAIDGAVTASAQFKLGNGSQAAPSYGFGDGDSGMWWSSGPQLNLTVDNAVGLSLTTSAFTMSRQFLATGTTNTIEGVTFDVNPSGGSVPGELRVTDGLSNFSGSQVRTAASTTTQAGLRLPHGSAPTSPADGDMWTTTAGLFVRINGVTVGPLD